MLKSVQITLAVAASVVALSGAAYAGVSMAGSHSTASPSVTVQVPKAATPAPIKTVIVQPPAPQVRQAVPAANPPQDYSSWNYAGNGVYAGPHTSVSFALAVHNAAVSSGYAASVVAYSPVTGQSYTMYQTSASPYVYSGGNDAQVEFSS
jgi:hypothetical protein